MCAYGSRGGWGEYVDNTCNFPNCDLNEIKWWQFWRRKGRWHYRHNNILQFCRLHAAIFDHMTNEERKKMFPALKFSP